MTDDRRGSREDRASQLDVDKSTQLELPQSTVRPNMIIDLRPAVVDEALNGRLLSYWNFYGEGLDDFDEFKRKVASRLSEAHGHDALFEGKICRETMREMKDKKLAELLEYVCATHVSGNEVAGPEIEGLKSKAYSLVEKSFKSTADWLSETNRGVSKDDLLQIAFLHFGMTACRYKHNASISYFATIGKNAMLNFLKTGHKELSHVDIAAVKLTDTDSDHVRRIETIDFVRWALDRLKEPGKEVIELLFFKEMSLEEVATKLNKSKGAVGQISRRAMQKLGKDLQAYRDRSK